MDWTPDKISKVKDLWELGKSLTDIGAIFGVTRNVISGVMNRNRDLFPKKKTNVTRIARRWKKDELERMAEMYKSGMLIENISKNFETSRATISSLVHRYPDLFPLRETPRSNYTRTKNLGSNLRIIDTDEPLDNLLKLEDYEKPKKRSAYSRVRATNNKQSVTKAAIYDFPKAIDFDNLPEFYRDRIQGETLPGYGVELVFIGKDDCRNPIVEDQETVGKFRFCGKPRNPLTAYCTECSRKLLGIRAA